MIRMSFAHGMIADRTFQAEIVTNRTTKHAIEFDLFVPTSLMHCVTTSQPYPRLLYNLSANRTRRRQRTINPVFITNRTRINASDKTRKSQTDLMIEMRLDGTHRYRIGDIHL